MFARVAERAAAPPGCAAGGRLTERWAALPGCVRLRRGCPRVCVS